MLKSLIWIAILTAIADPILLYAIFSTWGFWAGMTAMIGPIILGNAIANATHARGDNDPTQLLSIPARLLLWYPGPLTSVLGLILMTRFAQKKVASYALGKVMSQANSGQAGPFQYQTSSWVYMSSAGGPSVSPGPIGGPSGPAIRGDGLKKTEGRVIEDGETKQLSEGTEEK